MRCATTSSSTWGEREAVLVIDETGDLKKGAGTVGCNACTPAPRAASRTPRVAVYLVYATGAGHAVIDRELYLPKSWTDDPDRCRAAGVPDQVGLATKPALATRMPARALDAGVPAAWVTGEEVYGANPNLRATLEARGVGCMLAVACDHHMPFGGVTQRADALLRQVPARAWQQVSAGKGAKGHRYDGLGALRGVRLPRTHRLRRHLAAVRGHLDRRRQALPAGCGDLERVAYGSSPGVGGCPPSAVCGRGAGSLCCAGAQWTGAGYSILAFLFAWNHTDTFVTASTPLKRRTSHYRPGFLSAGPPLRHPPRNTGAVLLVRCLSSGRAGLPLDGRWWRCGG